MTQTITSAVSQPVWLVPDLIAAHIKRSRLAGLDAAMLENEPSLKPARARGWVLDDQPCG